MIRPALFALALVALPQAAVAQNVTQSVAPRTPLPLTELEAQPLDPTSPFLIEPAEQRLVVKFADAARVRVSGGASGALTSRSGADLAAVRALAQAESLAFAPLIRLPEAKLAGLEARARARSGRAQPDLAGLMIVELEDASPARLAAVGNALQALDQVEFAYIEVNGIVPPGDIAPPTPDYTGMQGYRGPDPGVDADYAALVGATGSGVRLSDCEYGWEPGHEDLNDIDLHLEPGQTIHPDAIALNFHAHGTAVVGETSGVDNAYGVTGMVPDAEVYTYPEWTVEQGFRRTTCITNAIADSDAGDVVLLEMQNGSGAPAEIDAGVWLAVKAGSDAGVVVVAAAGNGNQNLDGNSYASYRARGDSGAIIVGAGTSNTQHDKLNFSSFGARVNVQGWGQNVFTLGYGSFAQHGGDTNQNYTSTFSGTSSASPFVTSAVIALQSTALAAGCEPLSSTVLREHLIATGLPQGSGGHIGPFADIRAALDNLELCTPATRYCSAAPNSVGPGARISSWGSLSLADNAFRLRVSGTRPEVTGLFYFGTQRLNAPFGDGFRCVGGTIQRAYPLQNSDGLGYVDFVLDFGQPYGAAITSGTPLDFQYWYRDTMGPGGTGFNLTDAIEVTFQP